MEAGCSRQSRPAFERAYNRTSECEVSRVPGWESRELPVPLGRMQQSTAPGSNDEEVPLAVAAQRGGTFGGLLVGLLLGLAIAVGVALYVAKSPIPFIDKVSKPLERTPAAKSIADAPDPNMSMYPRSRVEKRSDASGAKADAEVRDEAQVDERDEKAATQEPGGAAQPQASSPAPGAAPAQSPAPAPGSALAPGKGAKAPPPASTPAAQAGASQAPPASSTSPQSASSTPSAPGSTATGNPGDPPGSYVQAGAFKVLSEAEALKARLALLGLESRVVKFDQGGQVFFRVRLGPYPRGEELNRTRNRLLEAGLDAVVVKQP